jgi:hypothetical protein
MFVIFDSQISTHVLGTCTYVHSCIHGPQPWLRAVPQVLRTGGDSYVDFVQSRDGIITTMTVLLRHNIHAETSTH